MCLSKPQKVIGFSEGFATVEFLGHKKKVKSFMPLKPGEYVISQANVVIQKIPAKQAKEMLKEWRELNEWK